MLYDTDNADWFSENAPAIDMQAGDDGVFRSADPATVTDAIARGGVVGQGTTRNANAGNLDALYQEWIKTHAGQNANMQDFADFLTANGVQASVARHGANGSLASDDKLIINGKVADFIINAGPQGQWGGINWDGGGSDGGGVGQYTGQTQFGERFTGEMNYPEWTKQFKAPTLAEAQQTPGYQFAQSQGEDAILRSAAKMGIARTGGTLKDVSDFNTNLANRAYGDIYNRALQDYNTELGSYLTNYGRARDVLSDEKSNFLTNYGIYADNFNRDYGVFSGNFTRDQGAQDQAFRQKYSLADLGLRATTEQAGLYTGYGTNVANIYTNGANRQGELTMQQGNANAAGQVGSANAYQVGLGNIGRDVTGFILNNQGRGVYRRPGNDAYGQDY